MTIYEIKERTKDTAPYFFTHSTMKFFHQTMSKWSVRQMKDGRTRISQPMRDYTGKVVGTTVRYFNPLNNELEIN